MIVMKLTCATLRTRSASGCSVRDGTPERSAGSRSGSAATVRATVSERSRAAVSVRSLATNTEISAPAATVTATTVSWRISRRPARLLTRIGRMFSRDQNDVFDHYDHNHDRAHGR